MKFRASYLAALLFTASLLAAPPSLAGALLISNKTDHDILNILAKSPGHEYYFRLDLDPDTSDEVENPDVLADIRMDSGLYLYHYPQINLAETRSLIFLPDARMIAKDNHDKAVEYQGSAQMLVPQAGDPPVCNLSTFHPAMPMKDVCAVLATELPRDDNGAILTGMGFAGLTWAARLVPEQPTASSVNGETRLEHMELRSSLEAASVKKVLRYFFSHDYAPWQAELPGLDMEFSDLGDIGAQEDMLANTLTRFLKKSSHVRHANSGPKCDQASVIFAPREMLPRLEASDEPESDAEVFTLVLRPCTKTLLVDVAAYRGNGQK